MPGLLVKVKAFLGKKRIYCRAASDWFLQGSYPAVASRGCNLNSPTSIQPFLEGNQIKQNPNLAHGPAKFERWQSKAEKVMLSKVGHNPEDLGPVGRRGAAAALRRLKETEERAHARQLGAIKTGNPFKIKGEQEFCLRSSEVLRRLDLAILTERRRAGEQVPKLLIEQVSKQISGWLRLAFEQFLSAETRYLINNGQGPGRVQGARNRSVQGPVAYDGQGIAQDKPHPSLGRGKGN